MLISFEGIDGAGKTTVARKVHEFLNKKGFKVCLFREPGGTSEGEKIREIILNYETDPRTELFLFLASRSSLVKRKVIPCIEKGYIVLLDRFTDSTVAYQGYGRGFDIDFVKKLCEFSSYGIKPDITFLLDISPEEALKRLNRERTRFEELEFLKKVREGFLKIAREEKERIVIIDASSSEEEVLKEVLKVLKGRLNF